jgi:hypothetical protein
VKILPHIDQSELVTRYIYGRFYNKDNETADPSAFMPRKIHAGILPPDSLGFTIATSVYRINNLQNHEIWELAFEKVIKTKEPPLIGRADISVNSICTINSLKVVAKSKAIRQDRHASIVDWPENDEGKKLVLAIKLANKSNFMFYKELT